MVPVKKRLHASGERQTARAAAAAAQWAVKSAPPSRALVLGLIGEMGAGKTAFAGAFLRALGVRGPVPSPTFALMREHALPPSERFQRAVHMDWHRIEHAEEILALGWEQLVSDPGMIILIEWADRFPGLLPAHALLVRLEGKGEEERIIALSFHGER